MVTIYVLELEKNKYYVGRTRNSTFRLDQHFNANGSSWTRTYKPIKMVEQFDNCDVFDEDKITIKYMAKYGIENVRGGAFCQIELRSEDKIVIKKMINGASDNCYKCNQTGHFAKYCKNRNATSNELKNVDIAQNDQKLCTRCGRNSHNVDKCYAKTSIQGELLVKNETVELSVTEEKKDNAIYLSVGDSCVVEIQNENQQKLLDDDDNNSCLKNFCLAFANSITEWFEERQ